MLLTQMLLIPLLLLLLLLLRLLLSLPRRRRRLLILLLPWEPSGPSKGPREPQERESKGPREPQESKRFLFWGRASGGVHIRPRAEAHECPTRHLRARAAVPHISACTPQLASSVQSDVWMMMIITMMTMAMFLLDIKRLLCTLLREINLQRARVSLRWRLAPEGNMKLQHEVAFSRIH